MTAICHCSQHLVSWQLCPVCDVIHPRVWSSSLHLVTWIVLVTVTMSFSNLFPDFLISWPKYCSFPFTSIRGNCLPPLLAVVHHLSSLLPVEFAAPVWTFWFLFGFSLEYQLLTVIFIALYHFNRSWLHSNKYLIKCNNMSTLVSTYFSTQSVFWSFSNLHK